MKWPSCKWVHLLLVVVVVPGLWCGREELLWHYRWCSGWEGSYVHICRATQWGTDTCMTIQCIINIYFNLKFEQMQTQDFFSIKKTLYLNFNIFEKILSFLVATWQCLSQRVCSHADKWRNKQEKYHCCPFSCAYTLDLHQKVTVFQGDFLPSEALVYRTIFWSGQKEVDQTDHVEGCLFSAFVCSWFMTL